MIDNKKECQRLHARRRAMDRYGLWLSNSDIDNIVRMINAGKVRFIETETRERAVFVICYKKTICKVAYDKQMNNICSFLPMKQR